MIDMDIYGIVLLCVVGAVLIVWLIDRFTGGAVVEKIVQWRPVLAAITALVKAVSNILPSSYFKTVIAVLEAAGEGTETAEELWKLGQLPKDERNAKAKEIAAGILEKAGIEVTDQIRIIIDGAIEMVCMLMPHGVVPYEA